MASGAGKGDKRRPSQVSREELQENWDRVFNKGYVCDCISKCATTGCKNKPNGGIKDAYEDVNNNPDAG